MSLIWGGFSVKGYVGYRALKSINKHISLSNIHKTTTKVLRTYITPRDPSHRTKSQHQRPFLA